MPILDFDNEFTTSGGQAVTAAANGTKVRDFGAAIDHGAGETRVPFARVTGAAASNPTTSMTIDIVGADNAALTTNPVVLSSITVLAAALVASSVHAMPPLKAGARKQFLGVKFTPNGGNATTGAFVVGMIPKDGRPQGHVSTL